MAATKRNFILSSGIGLSADNIYTISSTNSTSIGSGAFIVAGGVGIGSSVSIGGRLQMFNSSNYTAFVSSATGNTVYTLPATSPATGTSVLQSTSAGVLSWVPMTATGGSAGGAGTVYDGSLNSIPYYPTAGTAITGSSSFTNTGTSINIGYTTAATNSSSGALTIVGGVGIGGSLYVAGDLTINGTTTTINSVTLTVDDKNIELGSVSTPSDVTAEGGGITLKGASDKSINWYTGTGWSSSESWNLSSGNTFKINNTTVLSNSSLGTGVTNSSLTALGTITTGVWAGTLITALYGGTGFNSYTKGDLIVGAGNTFIKLPVGSQGQLLQAFSSATSGVAWTSIVAPTYGAFYSTQTQQVVGAGASTPITYNATFEAYNTQIYGGAGTSSRVQIQTSGTYNIQFSAQINLADGNQPQKGDFWFRINGSDVPKSNTSMSITGKDYETALALNFISYFSENDYFEIIMSSADSNFTIHAESGLINPPRPDIPSIIVTIVPVTQIVGSSAGLGVSGIVSLNGLNNYIQYFAAGNNGTDFNISSSSQTHTINIPIAGTASTGLITSQAQTIGGVKTFASPIIGSLTGTATTATSVNVVLAASNGNHPLLFTPTSGTASGVAISSNSTLVYNAVSDILSVSGLAVTNTTASTSTTSGALIVTGGVGIGQSVSVGGRLQLFNGANYTAFVSSSSGNTVYTLPATSPATGTSVLQSTAAGVMSWVPMVAGSSSSGNTSQNVVINAAGNANVFHPVLFTPLQNSSGSAVSSDSTISFNPSTEILNVSGLAITSGTASTNTTTGALVVRGGLGVTGQLSFATASFGFTGITTNPTMSFIGATSSSPITLTVLTDNSLNWEGSQGSVFSIDSNLSTGEIFSVSDISGLPIISASAGQTVTFNEFGGYTQFGNGSINSSSTTTGALVVSGGVGITGNANIGGTVRLTNTTASTSSTTGAMTVSGGVGIGGSVSIAGRLQLFNSSNYTAFVSSATGNTVYTLPATSPAVGTSYLTSNSSGVMSWTAPNKANYVLSFGAGFTPIADSADSVSLNVPYLPDGTLKYYFIKRIEYRNETLSGGTGLSFYLQRHTTGNASWNTTNTITAGSGASFYIGPSVYASSFTTIASSAGVAGSVVSGDYLRLFFTGVGSAANLSIAMTIEEQ